YPRTHCRSQPCGTHGRHEHPRRGPPGTFAAERQQPAYRQSAGHLPELETGQGAGSYPAQPEPEHRAGGCVAAADLRSPSRGHAYPVAPQRLPDTRQPSSSKLMPRSWLRPFHQACLAAILAVLAGCAGGLRTLTQGEVSSHYLINDTPPTIYRLVDENRRAWHAGDSSWQGRTWLNASSIGIEIVHPGYRDRPDGRYWYPWNPQQIDALIPLLQDILQRHGLPPERV